jgi:RHS repeat-associated protein
MQKTFDLLNRRTQLINRIGSLDVPNPAYDDFINTYTYNANGQITSIVHQDQATDAIDPKRVDYTYNAAGQPTMKTVYASTGTTSKVYDTNYSYDGMGRLIDLKHQNGSTIFADYDFGWDAASRITDFDFTPLGGTTKTADYVYDNTDQLTGATYNAFLTNESYQYDANGNRINGGFITGTNNRLTNDGTFTYTYDNEGNRLTKKLTSTGGSATTYTWDHRNRLTKVMTPTTTVDYIYDPFNLLIKRTVNGNASGAENFVHDGDQMIFVLREDGKANHRFFWGANVDELIADDPHFDTTTWMLCDHLGSVRDVLKTSGVVKHLEYDAFGKLINKSGAISVPFFRYTGKFTDDTTELQWNINRWYDANVGRWISEDLIGLNSNEVNLYRYVGNHPIQFLDLVGLWRQIAQDKFIYEAEDGDTFKSLLELISPDFQENNTYCIRPYDVANLEKDFLNRMQKDWNNEKTTPCGKYDATSLGNALPQSDISKRISGIFSVGRDRPSEFAISSMATFYHAVHFDRAMGLAQKIAQLADNGKTPIHDLILLGHGSKGKFHIGSRKGDTGGQFEFSKLAELTSNVTKQPWHHLSWLRAIKPDKYPLPYGCWFSLDVRIRLVGCHTSDMAQRAAERFVRKKGIIYGTTQFGVVSRDASWMGWANKENIKPDDVYDKVNTPEEYHQHKTNWSDINGTK